MKEISATILKQLGGNKFIAMTGCKNFIYDSNAKSPYLEMSIGRNSGKVNKFRVTLNSLDLYDLEFYKGSISRKTYEYKKINVQTFENVYSDQLQKIFTEVTGLYTSL